MRRYTYILILFVLLPFILASCKNKNNNEADFIITSFASDMDVSINGKNIESKICRENNGTSYIQIKSPKELENIEFSFEGDKHKVKLNELLFELDTPFLEEGSFIKAIINVLNEVEKKDSLTLIDSFDKYYMFSGTYNSQKFDIKVNKFSGKIEHINIYEIGLSADLYNFI